MNDGLATIAIALKGVQLDYWVGLVRSISIEERYQVRIVGCSSLENLRGERPDILICHENGHAIDYLKEKPDNVRWVQFLSSGVDRALASLSTDEATWRMTNVRGIHASAMAEYALTAMLYFAKRLPQWLLQKKDREWKPERLGMVSGSSVVILGTGEIGRGIAKICCSLSMRVLGVSRSGTQLPNFQDIVDYEHLDMVLPNADYLVVCVPLTSLTRGLLNRARLAKLPKHAVLINVSRGAVVDESAMREMLNEGRIAGAFVDAFQEEPLPCDSELWEAKNLIVTPHVAGRFDGSHEAGLGVINENIDRYFNDLPLINEIMPSRGY